jgi:MbtH protein
MDERVTDESIFQVVVNDEEQYSLWPAHRDLPAGWKPAGPTGPREECLNYIRSVWVDMRPRGLRGGERAPGRTG